MSDFIFQDVAISSYLRGSVAAEFFFAKIWGRVPATSPALLRPLSGGFVNKFREMSYWAVRARVYINEQICKIQYVNELREESGRGPGVSRYYYATGTRLRTVGLQV